MSSLFGKIFCYLRWTSDKLLVVLTVREELNVDRGSDTKQQAWQVLK